MMSGTFAVADAASTSKKDNTGNSCKYKNSINLLLKRKNKLNERAALDTNSFYVDLSNLFAYDSKTRADYKKKFDNAALGQHPGDYGMRRIAEEIFVLINACIHKKLI